MNLREVIILTASYYGRALSEPVLEMYYEDLCDLPTDQVAAAYKTYRRDPKNKTFPLPAQIRDLVDPSPTPEADARAVSGRISEAIVRFGHSNGNEAKLFIGQVGWDIVQSWGGWAYLCQNYGVTIDPGQFEAQTRNRAVDAIQYGEKLGYTQRGQIEVDRVARLQIEANRQKQQFAQLQIESEQTKTDPNGDYVALSEVERQQLLDQFLQKFRDKQLPGAAEAAND